MGVLTHYKTIKGYDYIEQWRVGPIAEQWGVHNGTVKRVLSQVGVSKKNLSVG